MEQKALAQKAGLTQGYLSQVEIGSPEHPVLGFQVFNNDKLLAADPAGEQEHDESKWRRPYIHA